MKLIFATANKGKLREAREILGEDFFVLSPSEIGIEGEAEETADTLKGNSLLKARYIHEASGGANCFADDTGLEVDALGGAPGVRSARYAGEHGSDEDCMRKLLSELDKLGPDASRRARFKTVITLILDGNEYFFEGAVEGNIAHERKGAGGFGYDQLFVPDVYAPLTLAQVSEEQKNAISHRSKALGAMTRFLSKYRPCHLGEDAHQDK